ncbi:hypothetical protein ACFQ49_06480 [Kroppenstedtia eburnea]|uniref:Lipoprotein n=1 Tax=Kroppenstedtia eburnea TaxID=714067 RepID=A0A1N7PHJ2_9BACL|nr:hypothetical protein [Kroppenstedtia eburnea]EGK11020.1 hypothetical protein HMPREF9374_2089 [Desmospora sp. 8437]QKI83289.1 hypothetical protein GXN75_15555 [Kroppenstedtia eburnea]SIT09809.1 hypothetical protein SAMN05421790_11288 [Kroppenstedtia eburnea]
MKRFALLLTLSVLLVFSSGCGLLVADKGEKEKKTKEEEIDAVEPSETFEEVEFKHINWFMGAPDPEEHGGIWLYNKEKHPGELDNNSWESNDMLLVQASSPKYDKYSLKVKKLQVIKSDVVKIVVKLEEDNNDKPAHEYISLKRGDLDGKKFVVETTDGKPVETK